MDETSWRVRLAKSNINIKHIDYDSRKIYFDFSYRPKPGAPIKWVSTVDEVGVGTFQDLAERLCNLVLELRKELEV